jgi:hypothetical protein
MRSKVRLLILTIVVWLS